MELQSMHFDKSKPVLQDLIVESKYDRITADRSVAGANFAAGPIVYKLASDRVLNTDMCKMNLRMKLTKGDGVTPLSVSDELAWCNNPIAPLFQRVELLCNNEVIDSSGPYVGEVDTLRLRQNTSDSWLNSVGKTTSWMEADLQERIERVSSDGVLNSKKLIELASLASFANAGTITYTAATGACVLAAGNTTVDLNVGDVIQLLVAGAPVSASVVSITDATTFAVRINGFGVADVAATCDVFEAKILRAQDSARVSSYEFVCHIPLSIFSNGAPLPPGCYSLRLYPENESSWRRRCIESNGPKVVGTDYQVTVEQFYVMAHTSTLSKPVPDGTYHIPREQIVCHADSIVSNGGLQNYAVEVASNSHAISVAFQDNLATTGDTEHPVTKFGFGSDNKAQLGLERLYMTYANRTMPSYQYDATYSANVDYTLQLWSDTFVNAGLIDSPGGCEPVKDHQERGSFVRMNTLKSPKDLSKRAVVYAQFNVAAGAADNQILIFDHSMISTAFHVSDGVVSHCMTTQVE